MNTQGWFSLLSSRQRVWLFGTAAMMLVIIGFGILLNPRPGAEEMPPISVELSIGDIAPTLGVTGKALAR